jgi:hypothetical protein
LDDESGLEVCLDSQFTNYLFNSTQLSTSIVVVVWLC